ncbi:5-methyltetrahydropteroyltriglutamate--homocysteine methyltransferase [Haloechinothrix alba]|uniref:5-methyltetrahydropteroyltriglutamate--homocysteine methyltransferase n=1 Tax=Haloechinothrix alba TaxID=664784 RepID=A0A238X3H5_9PSEU|nr:cobalamin-independent methionine synthase II family protein [Haloechinothrix alba]SNR53151.1 5-methyltetrahydropteroyltriglutamate--homocysteine methyltransferase [Haloechinothrix alba]
MKRSTDRILTTHVGSLARPHGLLETMREKEHGRPYDPELFAGQTREAVADVVAEQARAGIDVVTDGEQGKVTFATYVEERLGGFDTVNGETLMPYSWQQEIDAFPDYYQGYFGKYSSTVSPMRVMVCTGPVSYQGHDAVRTDIDNLKAAAAQHDIVETFLPATSPRGFGRNEYYTSETEYLYAVAEAMREEYLAITEAGLLLQIDDPWLIEILSDPRTPPEKRRETAHTHIDALNHALRGIPEEKIRLHTCYGLNHGPRVHDLPLSDVVDYMLRVNAGAYSFEVANPRHQHEWRIWETTPLPDGKILIPGLLSHATNFVEHPQLIADSIATYASMVGPENVIAGADCGFSSRATFAPEVDPAVVWAKFRALAEGAEIATKQLAL